MGEALVDIRRRIENATEAAAVKSALTDAASLDASCWKPGETLGWLTFLLEIVLPGWLSCFTIAERECIFDVFFIRAPPQDALSALHGYLCREGVSAEGLNPLIEIMTRRVPALICHAAGSSLASTSLWQMTLTSLFSLPERLANRTTRLPESLHPKSFATVVIKEALSLSSERTPIPHLIAALLGHASRLGHSDIVAAQLLALSPQISSSICAILPESSLQNTLAALILRSPSSSLLSDILSPLYQRSALAVHLLSHKFLLTRVFPPPAPQSLVALAQAQGKGSQVFARLAPVWAEAAFLQQAISLQSYVTDALLCLLKGAQKSDADAQLAALLQGVQRRLSSALPAVRSQGMRVAEALSAVATPELPLKFDVEMDDGEAVKKEPKEAYNMDTTSVVTEPAVAKDNKKKTIPDGPDDPDRLVLNDDSGGQTAGDEDEEEDLKPYDLTDDNTDPKAPERPAYIRDLISVLTTNVSNTNEGAPARLEVAMNAAPEIIRSSAHELSSLADTLLSALLQVSEASRGSSLQALFVTWPQAAELGIQRFYQPNYALTTRAALLDALIDSAHELSRLPKSDAVPREAARLASSNRHDDVSDNPLRIVGKVRRWASAPRPSPTPAANRFEPAVPHYFFPLLSRADSSMQALQLLADDASLLARMLYAAGVFVLCAGPASAHIERMADMLLQLLWSLRFTPAAHLRRAILISAWHVFSTAPASVLLAWPERLDDWRGFLGSLAIDEPDDECRLVAQYNLSVLHSKLQQSGFVVA